ncbi:MAG TPA: hypothetical protein VFA98_13190 [Thermoanaerobaculia bacterium]|nr:hypothetical protein [Thermoanaerobaculia bacterium]
MNREQLNAWVDDKFAEVVLEAKRLTPDMDPVERAGTIAGMLMKTAIALAAKHGAPREIIEQSIAETIEENYG